MKAIVYEKYGPPDVLRLEEVPKPIPANKQVLVNVHAVSINSWDWEWLTGKPVEYRLMSGLFKPKGNLMHGCDIAGRVEAVGEAVTHRYPDMDTKRVILEAKLDNRKIPVEYRNRKQIKIKECKQSSTWPGPELLEVHI